MEKDERNDNAGGQNATGINTIRQAQAGNPWRRIDSRTTQNPMGRRTYFSRKYGKKDEVKDIFRH